MAYIYCWPKLLRGANSEGIRQPDHSGSKIMDMDFLNLNDDKTDVLIVGTNCFLYRVNCSHLTIGDVSVTQSSHVKNIGTDLDSTLSMDQEVSARCKSAWWQLHPQQDKEVSVYRST